MKNLFKVVKEIEEKNFSFILNLNLKYFFLGFYLVGVKKKKQK